MDTSDRPLGESIARLDTSLLGAIDTQLNQDDRRSLLALHAACRETHGTFAYLEIGSHLGGSLQSFIRDPACVQIVSIDSRPDRQPDERGITYRYEGNSTDRMLENLGRLTGADLAKLTTLDVGTDVLQPADVHIRPQLCFVDGEHTDEAALRDARFCRSVVADDGCIAFHDAQVVYGALDEFTRELQSEGVAFDAYVLPRVVFVVELGSTALRSSSPTLAAHAREGYRAYLASLQETSPYRTEYRKPHNRVLRRIGRVFS